MATQQLDPNAFAGLVNSIVAGDSASGKASFLLPAGTDVSAGSVSWCLLDKNGTVHSQGNGADYVVTSTSFNTLVESHVDITAPSDLPPSSEGNSYQIRWALSLPGQLVPMYSFESVSITGLTSAPEGAETTIEMFGDPVTLGVVTTVPYYEAKFEVYDSMNRLIIAADAITVNEPVAVAGGQYYTADVDVNNVSVTGANPFAAKLDSYIVSWKFTKEFGRPAVSRMTSELFIVNSSILAAMEDCRRMVMKARTTMFGNKDLVFDEPTMLGWLRRARDMFNSAAGMLVEFSMVNATGGIREYWLQYAEVAMLRAHALAEGEKAFNFAGAAISLDVDKAQYYSGLADTIQGQLDANIKPFKTNLIKKNCVTGDGNMTGAAGFGFGASRLGLSIHPSSQLGRNSTMWNAR